MTDTAPVPLQALGICLEEYEYPYPVRFFSLSTDLQPLKMAYMDVPPNKEPNGSTYLYDFVKTIFEEIPFEPKISPTDQGVVIEI